MQGFFVKNIGDPFWQLGLPDQVTKICVNQFFLAQNLGKNYQNTDKSTEIRNNTQLITELLHMRIIIELFKSLNFKNQHFMPSTNYFLYLLYLINYNYLIFQKNGASLLEDY